MKTSPLVILATHKPYHVARRATALVLALIFAASAEPASAGLTGLFGGGPYYKNAAANIAEVEGSGFTEAIVWSVEVSSTGDLNLNGEFPLCSNGQYTGATTHSDFASNMTLLKQGTVRRVTLSIGSSNVGDWQDISALVKKQGTGSSSILYRNFAALKKAIPALDALDFDDENSYDSTTTTAFAVMVGNLGYKVELDPYTNNTYWKNLAASINKQLPNTVDAVHLQCYSGGAGNNPNSGWNFGPNIPVYPGLWDANDSPSQVQSKISGWKSPGGFMWLYDDFALSSRTAQYAAAINQATGSYTAGAYILQNESSSLDLTDPNASKASGTTIVQSTKSTSASQGWIFALNSDGSFTITNAASGLVLDNPGSSVVPGTSIDQATSTGTASQHWLMSLNSDGSYTLVNQFSGLVLDDPGSSTVSGHAIDQATSTGGTNQFWRLQAVGDHVAGTHLVPNASSTLVLDDPNAATASGTPVDQAQKTDGPAQTWTFTPNTDGSFTIKNGASGLVLGAPNDSLTSVDQETSTSGSNQHWFVNLNSDGSYDILNVNSGETLEDPNGSSAAGTLMNQLAPNGTTYQRWLLQ